MASHSGKGMKMKVQKYEIARVIDKLKSIVQKNDQFPALGGILVKDGYLIASNSEITMKVKLEASEDSYFIIPMKAFDLIKNLPDGEIDISATDKNVVMIKIGAIKNKYQSYPPEEFNFDITEDPEADGVELNGKKIMEAIGHVIYAAADGGIISMVLRNLADGIEKDNPGAKELRMWAENNTTKPELQETIKVKKTI